LRSLIFNTAEISFQIGDSSTRPKGIKRLDSDCDARTFREIAVAFLCVETDDCTEDASSMAESLVSYSLMVNRAILLVPFSHLSATPATIQDATLHLINIVSKRLGESNCLEGVGGFGQHKAMIAKWITLSHGGSVAFRDSKYRKTDLHST